MTDHAHTSVDRAVGDARAESPLIREPAQERLFRAFYERVREIAKDQFRGLRDGGDHSTVASSTLRSLLQHLERGELPRVTDAHSAWAFLYLALRQRCVEQWRREHAQKRGAGQVVSAAALAGFDAESAEATPEVAALMANSMTHFRAALTDREREVLDGQLAGYKEPEIAAMLGVSLRTVQLAKQSYRGKADVEFGRDR